MSRPGRQPMPGCCRTHCWPPCRTSASRPGGRACWPIPARRAACSWPTTRRWAWSASAATARSAIRVGEVYTLYVEPDFQNQGLGRRLLDALFRQLRADGCDIAVLWMLADNPSRFFYEGLGGERIGQRVDTMAGVDVEELAFGWRDLTVPLIRRKLATEE